MYSGRAKFLLEKDGRFVLSEGRARLLAMISQEGTLQAASRRMNMSYKRAWEAVKKMNAAAGEDLAVSERGGRDSGRTVLTEAGEEVLGQWNARKGFVEMAARYGPKPVLTVDAVLIRDDEVLLVKRKYEPHKGCWVFPGGFMEEGETTEDAASRELKEETGVTSRPVALVGVFSDPGRDPRHHTVSAAYLMDVGEGTPRGGDDAAEARFFPLSDHPELAFDHEDMLKKALRVRDSDARL